MNERIGSSLSGGETDSKNREGIGGRSERGSNRGQTMSRILAFFYIYRPRRYSVSCAPDILCCAAYVGNADSSVTHVLSSFPTLPVTLFFICLEKNRCKMLHMSI